MTNEQKTMITLKHPFKDGLGNEVTEIAVRRAKVRDIRRMNEKKTDAEKETFLLSEITGLMIEDMDLMDIADYVELQKCLGEMMQGKSAMTN